jgi:hypothetical protein
MLSKSPPEILPIPSRLQLGVWKTLVATHRCLHSRALDVHHPSPPPRNTNPRNYPFARTTMPRTGLG